MKSSKSRNFRRRAGEDEDEEDNIGTQSTSSSAKIKSTPPSTSSRAASAPTKPKKPSSQPTTKSLLSFADDEDSLESPLGRPSSKPSSASASRFSNKSAHKLTSSKERSGPHPTSSSLPSNVQPQAGSYTKEALLELQKNTKTLAAPARVKPKAEPEPEPVILLKGLMKPLSTNDLDSVTTEGNREFEDGDMHLDEKSRSLNAERDDALARMGKVKLEPGLREDNERIPDKATIDAIRAKRERLRQAKAAAPDYIALDGGSNHGEADGLSDEEPEFKARIGFFGEKVDGGDKKGVFEDFEDRTMAKDKLIVRSSDDEDEEDKMWEEEQVRKGLGKRLDDGLGNQGIVTSVSSVNSIRQSGGLQQSLGHSGAQTSGIYPPVQNVNASGYDSNVGAVRGLFSTDMASISVQAELTKKALNENLRRVKESHDRTIASLENTEENLSSSLLKVTALENSFSAAGEKFLFMQKLREFVSVLCEFLQHKAPFIEELEEQMQNLYEERARAITERRLADNSDEMSEIEPVMMAVQAEFRKAGSSAAKLLSASAAAEAASAKFKAFKSAPVELDEYGRDVNLQKRMDITRRVESRKRRRDKAEHKRMLELENDNTYQQMEGELSTDESDDDSTAYESTRKQLLQVADTIFSDADEEYSQFSVVIDKFERWKKVYASSYRDAYMSLSLPAVFSPYVRLELLKWDPLHEDADFIDMKWHSLLFDYGLLGDESKNSEDDADANLVPELVEKLAVPILHHQLASCWDMLSTHETKYAVSAMNLVVRYVNLSSPALSDLVAVLHDRLTNGVSDLTVPTWSSLEMNSVPNAARVAAYKFGTSVRLMRNICLWNNILAMSALEKIVLDQLLCGKILPHLHSVQSSVYDAISRTERVIAALYGVWAGPSVTGDRSRKLQPLVDYLLLIGKKLEKKLVSNAMEADSSKLARRLKKMLVELNEYDHARALSRTFNLKEAL